MNLGVSCFMIFGCLVMVWWFVLVVIDWILFIWMVVVVLWGFREIFIFVWLCCLLMWFIMRFWDGIILF